MTTQENTKPEVSDEMLLFRMRHLEPHLKDVDAAIPMLIQAARAILKYDAPTAGDALDAERWRFIRRKLCLTGNGNGTCAMHAINLPASIPGWPEPGPAVAEPGPAVAEFCDAAIDAAVAEFCDAAIDAAVAAIAQQKGEA